MGKKLKIGLTFMIAAVLLMPLAMVFKNAVGHLLFVMLVISMVLELIGLLFVVWHMIEKRKS